MTWLVWLLAASAVLQGERVDTFDLERQARAHFAAYARRDVLPDSTIQAIARDGGGVLWIGTQDGLARFDGHSWTAIPLPARATSRIITCLAPLPDGRLAIGTLGSGVYLRDQRGAYAHLGAPEQLPSNDVRALLDHDGALWIGTALGLVIHRRSDGDTRRIGSDSRVGAIVAAGEAIWSGSSAGLTRWSRAGERGASFSTRTGAVRSLAVVGSGAAATLWVGGEHGLEVRDASSGDSAALPLPSALRDVEITALHPADDGALWVGTYGRGLHRLRGDEATHYQARDGLADLNVLALWLEQDDAGARALFVGHEAGLDRAALRGWQTFGDGPNVLRSKVTGLYKAREAVWLAAEGELWAFSPTETRRFTAMAGRANEQVTALAEAPRGELFIGTQRGMLATLTSDAQRPRFETQPLPPGAPSSIWSLIVNADTLWMARRDGVFAYSRERREWTRYGLEQGLPTLWVWSLAITADGSLWAGTQAGLARLEAGRFVTVPDPALQGVIITNLQADGAQLWVATQGRGLFRLAPGEPTLHLDDSTEPRLPNAFVYRAVPDPTGAVWVTTNHGVARLDAERRGLTTYNVNDGLPSNESAYASAVISGARVLIGTSQGMASAKLTLADDRAPPAPLRLLSSTVNGAAATLDGARLSHQQNHLALAFSLRSLHRPEETVYRSQLIGLEEQPSEWRRDNTREFPGLAAGQYSFALTARDYLGREVQLDPLRFSVATAPWRAWWAYLLYAAAVAGGVYLALRARLRHMQKLAEKLEALVERRTAEVRRQAAELQKQHAELQESYRHADQIFKQLRQALQGQVLDGRYRLDEELGHGGFGIVYKATDLSAEQVVAVKVFRPSAGNDTVESLERFKREATTSTRISHPNAVRVYAGAVSDKGVAYMVMELLRGRSLQDELRQGPMALARALHIARDVTSALASAHALKIIHRDIKPDNVFLHTGDDAKTEVTKVLDFGVARMLGDRDGMQMHSMTGTGLVVGTPTYMAPERFETRDYDGRSDVYSIGVMLYEMLAGRPPFSASDDGVFSLIMSHMNKPPPPLGELAAGIPREVEALVMAALVKEPSERPTATRYAERLDALIASLEPSEQR